jgi:hypothetical protein
LTVLGVHQGVDGGRRSDGQFNVQRGAGGRAEPEIIAGGGIEQREGEMRILRGGVALAGAERL